MVYLWSKSTNKVERCRQILTLFPLKNTKITNKLKENTLGFALQTYYASREFDFVWFLINFELSILFIFVDTA